MALVKKLTKIGNSYGIVIPSEVLSMVDLKPNSKINITVEKGVILIHPVLKEDQMINEAFSKFVVNYTDTLQRLAQ